MEFKEYGISLKRPEIGTPIVYHNVNGKNNELKTIEKGAMKKWIYEKQVILRHILDNFDEVKYLNEKGDKGWENYHINNTDIGKIYYFKREI